MVRTNPTVPMPELILQGQSVLCRSAGIDGGQPARRTYGGNVTYTDWQKDNYFHAVRTLTGGVKRLGIEFDHINIDTLNLLKSEFPGMEFVDIAAPSFPIRDQLISSRREAKLRP